MTRDFNSFYEEALAKRGLAPGPSSGALKPGTFNQFYDRAVSRNGTLPPPLPGGARGGGTGGGGAGGQGGGGYKPDSRLSKIPDKPFEWMDAVSTVFDILSRPIYGTTQVASNVAEEGIDAIKQLNRGENPAGVMLGALGDTVGRSLVGPDSWAHAVFGSDPDRKRYTSEVIEEITDKAGEAFNPNYENRVDNVSPDVKGWSGLVGDILGDPTMYIPGAVIAKPITAVAKGVYKGVGPVAGVRALGYKSVGKMREYDTNLAAWRAEGEARAVAKTTGTPPTGGAPAAGVAPTPTPGPAPKAGAPGVVQRAQPVAPKNAFGAGVTLLSDALKTGATKTADFVAAGVARGAEKAASDIPLGAPVANTAYREASLAEQDVQRLSAQAKVESTRPPVAEPVGLEIPAESAPGFNQDFAVDVPPGAPVTAPKPDTIPDTQPIAVPKPPVPEGASEALDAILNTKEHVSVTKGRRLPRMDNQAKTVKELSGSGLEPNAIKDLLHKEHIDHVIDNGHGADALTAAEKKIVERAAKRDGVTPEEYVKGNRKGPLLGEADADMLYDIYDDAARMLHEINRVQTAAKATKAASEMPVATVAAVPNVAIDSVFKITRSDGFLQSVRTFIRDINELVAKKTVRVNVPPIFQEKLHGRILRLNGKFETRGIFSPQYDNIRQQAMHHWLSEDGELGKFAKDEPVSLEVSPGVFENVTIEEIRAAVGRLEHPQHEAILWDAATGREFRGPKGLSEQDGGILRGLWTKFYEDLTDPVLGIPGLGAQRSFDVSNTISAIQFKIQSDHKALTALLGPEMVGALRKTVFGDNPALMNEHFETLLELQRSALTPERLADIIRLNKYKIPGTQDSLVRPLFSNLKESRLYDAYAENIGVKPAQAVDNAVEAPPQPPLKGQEPTPPEAVPAGTDPAVAEAVTASPSAVPTHHVSTDELLSQVKEVKGSAAVGNPEATTQSMALDILLNVFNRDILKPKNLTVTTATGVKIDDSVLGNIGYRTDLWNMPKQVELHRTVFTHIRDNADAIMRNEGKGFERFKPSKEDRAAYPPFGYDKPGPNDKKIKNPDVMPPEKQAQWEWEKMLEVAAVVDDFLPKIGVRQVIGTTKEEAIPVSFGDILRSMDHLTSEKTLGSMSHTVRNLLFLGSQHPGAGKVNPTNLLESYRLMLNGEPEEVVVRQLLSDVLPGERGMLIGPTTEAQAKGGQFTLGQQPNNFNNPHYQGPEGTVIPSTFVTPENITAVFPNATLTRGKSTRNANYRVSVPGTDMAQVMYRLMQESLPDIGATAIHNGWRGANTVMEEAEILISKESHEILEVLAKDPTRVAELMRHLSDLTEHVDDAAKAETMYPTSVPVAVEQIEAQVGIPAVRDAESAAKVADAQTPGAGPVVNAAEHEAAVRERGIKDADDAQTAASTEADNGLSDMLDNPEFRAEAEALHVEEPPLEPPLDAPVGAPPVEPPAGAGGGGNHPPGGSPAAHAINDNYDAHEPYLTGYLNAVGKAIFNTGKFFNASLGMSGLFHGLHSTGVLGSSYLAKVSDDLVALSKEYTQDEITTAFKSIQKDEYDAADPLVIALNDKINLLWSTSNDTLLGNAFLSNTTSVEHLNGLLRKWFPEGGKNRRNPVPQFDLDAAKRDMKATGDTLANSLAKQWREWPVDDGADFLQRMMSAGVNVAEQRAVVNLFERNMDKWGGVSDVPLDGWAKPRPIKGSSFMNFINQDKYYPRELLDELHHADVFTSTSRQYAGEHSKWINEVYAPWLNAWKRSLTINRPGHHIRTQIGDSMLTYTVRGHHKSGEAFMDANKIMSVAGKYEDVDFMKMLTTMHTEGAGIVSPLKAAEHPKFEDPLFTGHLPGGAEHVYTVNQATDAIHRHGLRPTYITGEGLYENPQMMGKMAKWASYASLEKGPLSGYAKAVGTISQARDHWTRAQHFQQIMRQEMGKGTWRKQFAGQWKTVQELEALAAKEVKRYHPDASMLTPGEAKSMRLVFPFYSWMAKIMPAFFESFIRYPGRVTVMPKASYNMAVASGLNPDSMYDPFPSGEQFPSYLTNKALGPQFNAFGMNYGINPGIPQVDLLNQLLGTGDADGIIPGAPNPLTSIGSLLSPLPRVAGEIATQSTVGGIPIKDWSDYFDSQIPGGTYMAGVTGRSPSSLFTQDRRMVEEDKYDPLLNDSGAWSGDSITSLLNYLTGLSFTGMGHVNQKNFAEIEARNAGGN